MNIHSSPEERAGDAPLPVPDEVNLSERGWRLWLQVAVAVVLAIFGLALLLQPVVPVSGWLLTPPLEHQP